jgi:hypothetical protein
LLSVSPNFFLELFERMKVVPHYRCDSMSSISMDLDWLNDVPYPACERQPGVDSPSDAIPKEVDVALDPLLMAASMPTDVMIDSHKMTIDSFDGSPHQVPSNPGSNFHVVQDGDYQFINSPPYQRPSPTFRLSHRRVHSDSPFSSFKSSRYSLSVLGDDVRPATKSSMTVRKMFTNTRTVLPLHRSNSENKPKLHRRDSFASLPKIADIGISSDDLMEIGVFD